MGRTAMKNKNPESEGLVNTPAAPVKDTQTNSALNQLNDDTVITVKALVPKVYYTCPVTHEPFAWEEVGDTQDMTLKQLKTMKAKHSRYLTDRWLMVLNEAAVKKLNLHKVYGTLTITDKAKIRKNDVEAVEELLSRLSNEGRNELAQYAIKSAKEGKLENIKIVRLLEKQLGVELMSLL